MDTAGGKGPDTRATIDFRRLSKIQLGKPRVEIEAADIPGLYKDTPTLLNLCKHTANDSMLVLELMAHLQVIPLTKQLTTLAGNQWARTLRGGKAERNEWLLLHEFFRARKQLEAGEGAGGETVARPSPLFCTRMTTC